MKSLFFPSESYHYYIQKHKFYQHKNSINISLDEIIIIIIIMSVNKNSSNYNGEQSLDEASKSAEKTKKPTSISEEKKQQIREKNKLAMQKRRASFSEEKKQQLREQERLKRQQKRDTQSIEEREAFNLKQRQRRANFANLSDEDRAIIRKKNSVQHRNKYHEDKLLIQQHQVDKHSNNNYKRRVVTEVNEDEDEDEEVEVDGDEEEDQVVRDSQEDANDHVNALLLKQEKRNAQNRIYKKARYAELREAEEKLKAISTEGTSGGGDVDIQQLQLLANRRQQILQYARTYRQNHLQHNRRWVPIQQVWDEDNPCR